MKWNQNNQLQRKYKNLILVEISKWVNRELASSR